MAEDEQESNGSEEIEVEVHALAYTPPTRLSSWRTSTAPNHIVTYCLDFESIETGQDDEDDSQKCSGGTDSVPESQDNEAKERSSSSSESTDLDLELADIRKEEKNCPGGLND